MIWFRRERDPAPPTAVGGSVQENDASALRAGLSTFNRLVNVNSGRIPGRSVVTALRVCDVLRETIETAEHQPLDIHTAVSVERMLTDYLPTTLRTFLAVDETRSRVVHTSGRTPVEALQEQLESLLDAAVSVRGAARERDADAMFTQGNFLRTKFSGSDLDL